MGFVVSTQVEPTHPQSDSDQYEMEGILVYHGPITEPLASNPAFDMELQLQHQGGDISIVQYYLPLEMTLPVESDQNYVFFFREKWGFEVYGMGLIIHRPTSGVTPLLFVGNAGNFVHVFPEEEPLTSPLEVYREPRSDCPPEPMPQCEESLQYWDHLRFDSSTGGQETMVLVNQTNYTKLPIFGDDFWVVNLASRHHDPPCGLDDPAERIAYLASAISPLPQCDTNRFYMWY